MGMEVVGKKRKQSTGRKKIAMERIERKSSRDTCFSKRWRGLFKKASELAILAGVELAVVVFSPGGSPFCIGHPSVDDVIDRYLDPSHVPKAIVNSTEIEELASSLMEVRDSVAPVQLKESVMETMGLEELEQEMRAMKKFRAEVQARIGTGPMHDGDQPAAVAGNQFLAMLGDLHAVVPHQALGQ